MLLQHERGVALPAQPAPILGTMLTPDGETRAVAVIIAGSGPTDRDGNNPLVPERIDLLKQIAELLARQIKAGYWHGGERLPTEAALADTLKVAVGTLRKSLALLEAQGGGFDIGLRINPLHAEGEVPRYDPCAPHSRRPPLSSPSAARSP